MNINDCYSQVLADLQGAEKSLFQSLTERFSFVAQQRIADLQDAQEVVQDALVAVSRKYRAIKIESSFAAWAHRVLENEIMAYYRKKGRREGKMAEFAEDERAAVIPSPNPGLGMKLMDCLKEVNRDNRRYARALNLHYQGFTTEEICARLEITENNSYVVLSRARTLLMDCLDAKGAI